MKKFCKCYVSFLLLICMLLSLCACGGSEDAGDASFKEYIYNEDRVSGPEALLKPENTLDASKLYSTVTYTPAMLCGLYSYGNQHQYGISIEEQDAVRKEFTEAVSLVPYQSEYAEYRSTLPIAFRAGYNTIYSVYSINTNRFAMEMTFVNENDNIILVKGYFTVSGNTLSFYPFTEYNYDSETETLTYELSEESMDFQFSFCGPELTLSADGKSATLKAHGFEDGSVVTADCYAAPNSPLLGGIDEIFCYAKDESGDRYKNFRMEITEGAYSEERYTVSDGILHLGNDGLATISWTDDFGQHAYQAIYFFAGDDGLVLYDGETTYYYTDDYQLRNYGRVSASVPEEVDLEVLTDEEVEDLSEKRISLLKALSEAFTASNLNVKVDLHTGEVMLDSAVLFALNSSEISAEGQAFLQEFIRIYSEVITREEYDGFVAAVVVGGHTDTRGSYESNQVLSEERANGVMNYCLSEECGLEEGQRSALEAIMESKGYSYDYPIIATDGSIDMDASRRVSFNFLIVVE